MPEIKLKYNEESEEVELVVDGEVALSSGKDVFESWVGAYNEKHPVEPVVVEPPAPVDVEPAPVVDSEEKKDETTSESKEDNSNNA